MYTIKGFLGVFLKRSGENPVLIVLNPEKAGIADPLVLIRYHENCGSR